MLLFGRCRGVKYNIWYFCGYTLCVFRRVPSGERRHPVYGPDDRIEALLKRFAGYFRRSLIDAYSVDER
jgi:hypothetical protein